MANIINQEITDQYAIYHADCMEVMRGLPDGSVHLSIYSPPFATKDGKGLYTYSSSERDLSNNISYDQFFQQYEYQVAELSRITMPGRINAVHCMDVPKQGANICGSIDFPGDIIRLYEKHGFEYLPRITIWKEPLAVRNRTMAKALAHCQICDDSTLTNVAAADYLVPFRKKGKNPAPVRHPTGLHKYCGERIMPADLHRFKGFDGDQKLNKFSHWIWRQYASSVWDDIRVGNVVPFWEEGEEDKDEKHPHPLQLDVIERAVALWSNPDEVVFTPFMGVGSECYGAVANGRKAIGAELKGSYFAQAVKNMKVATESLKHTDADLGLSFAEAR